MGRLLHNQSHSMATVLTRTRRCMRVMTLKTAMKRTTIATITTTPMATLPGTMSRSSKSRKAGSNGSGKRRPTTAKTISFKSPDRPSGGTAASAMPSCRCSAKVRRRRLRRRQDRCPGQHQHRGWRIQERQIPWPLRSCDDWVRTAQHWRRRSCIRTRICLGRPCKLRARKDWLLKPSLADLGKGNQKKKKSLFV